MVEYENAFARHRYDVGSFTGFTASIEVDPHATHMEKERPMKIDALRCLKPIVDDLVKNNILKIADTQGKFLSNSHGVAKPQKGIKICGKADEYLMRKKGQVADYSRLCVDLRGLNSHCPASPKINLPSYENLVSKFKNKHVSMIDIKSMYWAIRTDYESQSLTNFYFDRHVYAFQVLPMGYKNACFVGQTATEITYSQQSMIKFLQYKGWLLNSSNWPFENISEILIVYSDDVALFSPNNIPNSVEIL